ncbi:MAG: hypothetical protein WC621_05070 [Patescibacteria group bacterium]
MNDDSSPKENNEIRVLLEQNLAYTKDILRSTEKTRRYIFWAQIMGFVKVLLIVAPLILAFFYLQPYFRQAVSTYSELLGTDSTGSTSTDQTNQPSPASLLQELQRLQKSGDLKNIQQLLK